RNVRGPGDRRRSSRREGRRLPGRPDDSKNGLSRRPALHRGLRMTRLRRCLVLVALVASVASTPGGGYKLAGTGTFLPKNIKTIAVAPFENRPGRPAIEVRVTESVAREMSRHGSTKIVTDKTQADAYLE